MYLERLQEGGYVKEGWASLGNTLSGEALDRIRRKLLKPHVLSPSDVTLLLINGAIFCSRLRPKGSLMIFIVFAAATLALVAAFRLRRRDHLPPGPFSWPFIGNALQFPRTHFWLWLTKLRDTYGLSLCFLAAVIDVHC